MGALLYHSLTPLLVVPAYLSGILPRLKPKAQVTTHNLFL